MPIQIHMSTHTCTSAAEWAAALVDANGSCGCVSDCCRRAVTVAAAEAVLLWLHSIYIYIYIYIATATA